MIHAFHSAEELWDQLSPKRIPKYCPVEGCFRVTRNLKRHLVRQHKANPRKF